MCGIGGILFAQGDLQEKIQRIHAKQTHRGPDGLEALCWKGGALCHERLSLLDARGGSQPLKDPTQRYAIVYNGEIYNHEELRKTLSSFYSFQTTSDTEVLLAAFLMWGEGCLQQINGMFSFLIWDHLAQRAFAARDPLGVKPFVYSYEQGVFSFASEVKTLLALSDRPREIDPYLLAEYVIAPYFSGAADQSLWKGIRYLEPGTYLSLDSKGIHIQPYTSFPSPSSTLEEKHLVDLIEQEIEKSVKLSVQTDHPLGIFLSGGLDSSLLAAIASLHAKDPLLAYSLAFEHPEKLSFDAQAMVNSDDFPYAHKLAEKLSFPLEPVYLSQKAIVDSLPMIAEINDRIPAWEQEISQHLLSKAASKTCKAVLVGDASDEIHYGYFFLLQPDVVQSPLHLMNFFAAPQRVKLLSSSLQRDMKDPLLFLEERYRGFVKKEGLSFGRGEEENILAMSALLRRCWLQRLLHNGDIHTMHFGLEARVPFANQSYLRAACQIPPHLGFKGSTEKHILRQAAQKWLPPLFSERKKSALPRDPRLGKAYQNALLPLIQRHKDLIEPYLDIPALLSLCHIENVKEADRMILFNMISFIHWFTIYAKK